MGPRYEFIIKDRLRGKVPLFLDIQEPVHLVPVFYLLPPSLSPVFFFYRRSERFPCSDTTKRPFSLSLFSTPSPSASPTRFLPSLAPFPPRRSWKSSNSLANLFHGRVKLLFVAALKRGHSMRRMTEERGKTRGGRPG